MDAPEPKPNKAVVECEEKELTMTTTLTIDQRMLQNCPEELKQAQDEIHRLKHQHLNDDCANRMLLEEIERQRACIEMLMPLLEMAAPFVFASAEESRSIIDGFDCRHPIDELVDRIKAVLPD